MSWDDSERITSIEGWGYSPPAHSRSKRRPPTPIKSRSQSLPPVSMPPSDSLAPMIKVANEAAGHIMSSSPPSSPQRRGSHRQRELSKRELIVDTVAGMKDLAVESVSGFKEWASSPTKSLESSNSIDELKKWALGPSPRLPSKRDFSKSTTPDQAVHSLYGEQPTYETVTKSYSEEKQANSNSLVQDMLSPFFACTSGYGVSLPPSHQETLSSRVSRAVSNVIHDDTLKALERRESRDSLLSLDTQLEDEMYQIQRLTSWNTMATEQTYGTHVTYETFMTDGTAPSQKKVVVATTDDDGNIIPPALVEQVEKRQQRHRGKRRTRRKRVVQFDYPPIRSVKECPRVDPNDLDKLFFTEEELDQFEDDRYNTRMADDVEIIAVASPLSEDDGAWSFDNQSPSNKHKSASRRRKSSADPPSPVLTESSESGSDKSSRKKRNQQDSVSRESPEAAAARRRSSSRRAKSPDQRKKSPRLIKGVQIYMRERSIG